MTSVVEIVTRDCLGDCNGKSDQMVKETPLGISIDPVDSQKTVSLDRCPYDEPIFCGSEYSTAGAAGQDFVEDVTEAKEAARQSQ